MTYLPSVIAAALQKRTIRRARLVMADFRSGALRLWSGRMPLVAGGETWVATHGLVQISEIDMASGAFASPFAITLAGMPGDNIATYTRLMLYDASEYRGRRVVVYSQYFDEEWQPLDSPVALRTGVMDKPKFSGRAGQESITLQCESALVSRKRPRYSNYTDPDQQARYAGDTGFEYAPVAAGKTLKMPVLPP